MEKKWFDRIQSNRAVCMCTCSNAVNTTRLNSSIDESDLRLQFFCILHVRFDLLCQTVAAPRKCMTNSFPSSYHVITIAAVSVRYEMTRYWITVPIVCFPCRYSFDHKPKLSFPWDLFSVGHFRRKQTELKFNIKFQLRVIRHVTGDKDPSGECAYYIRDCSR